VGAAKENINQNNHNNNDKFDQRSNLMTDAWFDDDAKTEKQKKRQNLWTEAKSLSRHHRAPHGLCGAL
jgi:hypothetical protein